MRLQERDSTLGQDSHQLNRIMSVTTMTLSSRDQPRAATVTPYTLQVRNWFAAQGKGVPWPFCYKYCSSLHLEWPWYVLFYSTVVYTSQNALCDVNSWNPDFVMT